MDRCDIDTFVWSRENSATCSGICTENRGDEIIKHHDNRHLKGFRCTSSSGAGFIREKVLRREAWFSDFHISAEPRL